MIFVGFLIGFLGYLPPGNINLTIVQMSANGVKGKLWYFLFFATFMEFVYCFASMAGMKFLLTEPALVLFMQWASVAMFSILALLSFTQKIKEPGVAKPSVRRGLVIAVLNPLQVPFWLIWGVYVFNNHWVQPTYFSITLFSIITASGAFTVLWLYAVAGRKMQNLLSNNQRTVNVVIGCVFIMLALFQLPKLIHPVG